METKTRKFENVYGENGEYQLRDRMLDLMRYVPELDSYKGTRVYDIDGFIWNKNNNNAFIIENKTHLSMPKSDQILTLSRINKVFECSSFKWKGVFLIVFENTGPDDGRSVIYKMIDDNFVKQFYFNEEYNFWGWIENLLFDKTTIVKKEINDFNSKDEEDEFLNTPVKKQEIIKKIDPNFKNDKIIDDIL